MRGVGGRWPKASVALVRGLGGQNPSVCEFLHHSHWWRESCRSAVCVGGVRFLLKLRRFEKLFECSKKFADRRHRIHSDHIESPAVPEYKAQQSALVSKLSSENKLAAPPPGPFTAPPALLTKKLTHSRLAQGNSQKSLLLRRASFTSELGGNERLQRGPEDMRCLALISHNHMKPAMREFVEAHREVLKCFRLTGTNSTMTMLRQVLGEDASFGPACASGPQA